MLPPCQLSFPLLHVYPFYFLFPFFAFFFIFQFFLSRSQTPSRSESVASIVYTTLPDVNVGSLSSTASSTVPQSTSSLRGTTGGGTASSTPHHAPTSQSQAHSAVQRGPQVQLPKTPTPAPSATAHSAFLVSTPVHSHHVKPSPPTIPKSLQVNTQESLATSQSESVVSDGGSTPLAGSRNAASIESLSSRLPLSPIRRTQLFPSSAPVSGLSTKTPSGFTTGSGSSASTSTASAHSSMVIPSSSFLGNPQVHSIQPSSGTSSLKPQSSPMPTSFLSSNSSQSSFVQTPDSSRRTADSLTRSLA